MSRTHKTLAISALGALLLTVTVACATLSVPEERDQQDAQPFASPVTEAPPSPEVPLTPAPLPTTYEEVESTTPIPFEKTTVEDPQRDVGLTEVTVAGAEGTLLSTYRVTFHDGVEVTRELISEVVAQEPTHEVTAVGTRQPAPIVNEPVPFAAPSQCDPNYADACVPIASDVDCAGGSGNGPAYVKGPVRVIGTDIYDLDRDGDGIGCDG